MGIGFDYPKDGNAVNGAGLFCAWGTYATPIMGISRIEVSWTQGGVSQSAQVDWWFPSNSTWAADVSGAPFDGTKITLKVVGMSQPNPSQPPVEAPQVIGITCLDHAPQSLGPVEMEDEE